MAGGDVQGQGASSQAPLAPCFPTGAEEPEPTAATRHFYGSSFRISQPQLLCHQRGLELIWSRVKACKAPGVDGTHSLNSLFEDKGRKLLRSLADSAGWGSWPS